MSDTNLPPPTTYKQFEDPSIWDEPPAPTWRPLPGTEFLSDGVNASLDQARPETRHKRSLVQKVAAVALSGAAIAGSVFGVGQLLDGDNKNAESVKPTENTELSTGPAVTAPELTPAAIEALKYEVLIQPDFTLPKAVADKLPDKNKDPVFRASAVTIYGLSADRKRGDLGTAGLIQRNGHLELQSIEHVQNGFAKINSTEIYALFPGIGTMRINQSTMLDTQYKDNLTTFSLNDKQQQLLRYEASQGEITPLTREVATPKIGDVYTIANPETGDNIELTYVAIHQANGLNLMDDAEDEALFVVSKYNDEQLYADALVTPRELNELNSRLKGTVDLTKIYDKLCQGYSGSPLKPADHPNQDVGALGGVMALQTVDGRLCGLTASIRMVQEP